MTCQADWEFDVDFYASCEREPDHDPPHRATVVGNGDVEAAVIEWTAEPARLQPFIGPRTYTQTLMIEAAVRAFNRQRFIADVILRPAGELTKDGVVIYEIHEEIER